MKVCLSTVFIGPGAINQPSCPGNLTGGGVGCLRHSMAERKEIQRYTPLSRVSKARVANALKITRLEKHNALQELLKIQAKLKEEHLQVSDAAHKRLSDIMDTSEKNSFIQMFWNEQKKAFERKAGGMRWHTMMVLFAILLHSQSPSAYLFVKLESSNCLPRLHTQGLR